MLGNFGWVMDFKQIFGDISRKLSFSILWINMKTLWVISGFWGNFKQNLR